MSRRHGGRPPRGVIDLSAPLNPLGPPEPLSEALRSSLEEAYKYPDYDYARLKDAISGFYGIDPELIVPLAGAAEAYTLALAALRPSLVVTVEPTFGDHPSLLTRLGVRWLSASMIDAGDRFKLDANALCSLPGWARRSSLVIVSNPNNPTGHVAPRRVLESLSSCFEDATLIVDEAFMDLSPLHNHTMLDGPPENVIVVRSLTKPLAAPGLRVGFAYTSSRRLAALLDAARQPWNVGGLEAAAVAEILERYQSEVKRRLEEARRLVASEASRLQRILSGAGVRVYETHAPYALVFHPCARHPEAQTRLSSRGVYVRDASSFHGLTPLHSRVSIKTPDVNERVFRVLAEVLGGC